MIDEATDRPAGGQLVGEGVEGDELFAQPPQFGEAAIDLVDLAAHHPAHIGARFLAPVAEREDLADLMERDPEALGALDEGEQVLSVVVVGPVAGGGALGFG